MYRIIILLVLIAASARIFSQNITGTLAVGGSFIIKDNSNTFLSLSQSTGDLSLNRKLSLGSVTSGSQNGFIFRGSDRFIHTYFASGTTGYNTFIGINSGNFTMSGTPSQANYNTGVGHSTLLSLTTGYNNSAFGYNCLRLVSSGAYNTGFGYQTLSAVTSGNDNVAFGNGALSGVTIGSENTALGPAAGMNITTGSNNIVLGSLATVPSGTGSNQVRIGNSSITYAGIQVAWTITSDVRLKSGIKSSVLGLDFISRLNPVSYTRINDAGTKTEFGFIAQEVKQLLDESGVENTGMISVDDEGTYSMRYNDLIAPVVKSVQELSQKCIRLEEENKILKNRLDAIEKALNIPETQSPKAEE